MKYKIKDLAKKALIGLLVAKGIVSLVNDVIIGDTSINKVYTADVYGDQKLEIVFEQVNSTKSAYTESTNGYEEIKNVIRSKYQQKFEQVLGTFFDNRNKLNTHVEGYESRLEVLIANKNLEIARLNKERQTEFKDLELKLLALK